MFEPIINLYKQMDNAWDKIAGLYGFKCNGCEDNCCRSLFFHHTYIEKALLLHGLSQLEQHKQADIRKRAEKYVEMTFSAGQNAKSLKIMCPLNEEGKCILYFYRPMICRLHGLPHELHIQGGRSILGQGCRAGNFDDIPYIPFDRTPFYQQMAQIEADWRREKGHKGKIKETVAEIIKGQG